MKFYSMPTKGLPTTSTTLQQNAIVKDCYFGCSWLSFVKPLAYFIGPQWSGLQSQYRYLDSLRLDR